MKCIARVPVVMVLCAALALMGCQKKPAPAASAPQGAGGDTRGMIAPGGSGAPEPQAQMPPQDQGQMPPAGAGQMPPAGQGQMPPGHEQMMGTVETPPPASAPDAAAGVKWTMPRRWTLGGDRPMRVATYLVPAAGGDPEGGECGVFYFGATQGGNVESNIQRWLGQFQGAGPAERSEREVNGLKVALVKVTGTYLSPSGPMMQSTGNKPGYALLGAIVSAPQGSVFFKLTGPRKTLDAAKGDFDALVGSMKKE